MRSSVFGQGEERLEGVVNVRAHGVMRGARGHAFDVAVAVATAALAEDAQAEGREFEHLSMRQFR